MNQYKIDFFLKFADHHQVKLNKTHNSRDGQICKDQGCTTCVHLDSPDCEHSIVTDDEVEFLKLNHPEHFI